MKDSLGVALTAASASAVLLRVETPVWSHAVPIANDESRPIAIQRLLESAPRRHHRATLGVLVDDTYVQVRCLEGLPSLDHALQTRLVHQNASTFFLKRDGGVVTSDLHRDGIGAWGAAFDRDIVDEIGAVAAKLKLRLLAIAPARNGADDARSAARVDVKTPLAWTPAANREPRRERVRLLLAVVIMLGATTIALLAPAIRVSLSARRMMREIAASSAVELEAASTSAELRRITLTLNQRATFDASRGRMMRLINDIARALPESTALASIRADSADINLVAVSRRVTDVLPALAAVADPPSLRLVGSVSHDMSNGTPLERAAFRFRQVRRGDVR